MNSFLLNFFFSLCIGGLLWGVSVYLAYRICAHFISPYLSRLFVRILYTVFFIAVSLFIYFISPFKSVVAFGKIGFWSMLIIDVILMFTTWQAYLTVSSNRRDA